jgi:3-isopropylmalate/(R)-2-methylmalate dehydratase small subunit
MESFTRLTAIAVPLEPANIDTDQIIPARFLLKQRDENYASYLFRDLRFDPEGAEKPDFALNRAAWRDARIIVANRNFGCGSSREGAVFTLAAYGIRSIIAPSFGDIFFNNCFNNGVLPVVLDDDRVADLRRLLHSEPGAEITVDLEARIVTGPDGAAHGFDVDPHRRARLLEGLDAIGHTLQFEDDFKAFEARYIREANWLFDGGE